MNKEELSKRITSNDLKNLLSLYKEFNDCKQQYNDIDYYLVHSVNYSNQKSSSKKHDVLENEVIKIQERKNELMIQMLNLSNTILETRFNALKILFKIPSRAQQETLYLRYFMNKSVKEIMKIKGYSDKSHIYANLSAGCKSFDAVQ